MNAKQRRVFRRAVVRYMDAWYESVCDDGPVPYASPARFSTSNMFWDAVAACERAAIRPESLRCWGCGAMLYASSHCDYCDGRDGEYDNDYYDGDE